MLNIEEVHEAIKNLEQNCPTTYSNCLKLASLYIIRQYYNNDSLKDNMTKFDDSSLDIMR